MLKRSLSSANIAISMNQHVHRVVIYTACYNVIDGVTVTIRKIEKEILASGGHVCIVTTKSGITSNTNIDGLFHPNRRVIFLDNSVPIPFLYDPDNPETQYHLGYSLSPQVQKQIRDFEPTVVHVTVPDCACLAIIKYARDHNLPLMGTYHSNIVDYMDHYPGTAWIKPILKGLFRHNYNFLQSLYVPTPYIRRHLTNDFGLDSCTNLGIWGRGIDVNKFSPAHRCRDFRRKLGFADDDVVICMVGRLVPEKRPDIFARVMCRLHREGVNFKALVVGTGPYQDKVKCIPNTTFVGWMSGDDLSMAYASCDIFLFPSAIETFGNVTLEAAASGLPLVVESNCSGHLVRDGFNGYACKAGDVDSFYDATLDLVLDMKKRQQYAMNSRKFSLEFEQHSVVQEMLSHYSDVTNEFYNKYDGLHSNRDAVWEESFQGGTQPMPCILQMIVFLFVIVFRLMWFFTSCLELFQNLILNIIMSRVSNVIYSGVVDYYAHRQISRDDLNLGITKNTSHWDTAKPDNKNAHQQPQIIKDGNNNFGDGETIFESEESKDNDTMNSSIGDWSGFQTLAEYFVVGVMTLCRIDTFVMRNVHRRQKCVEENE